MGVMPDHEIRRRAIQDGMIAPFRDYRITPLEANAGIISFGVTSAGYDISLGREFLIFDNTCATVVDPKNFDRSRFREHRGEMCLIPPNSFILAETVETVKIPKEYIVLVLGKSTYARCGLITNFTPLEPAWRGKITVEISNTTPLPAKVYAGEGIAQLLFLRLESPCEKDYDQKPGRKYQDQKGLTIPKV